MDFSFRQQIIGDAVRLVLNVEEDFAMDEFALNMMNRNDPGHLVSVQLVQRDRSFYLQYDVNDMQPLQSRMAAKMRKREVMHVLNSVIEAFEEAEDYMLTEDILVLDRNYVYVDAAGECRFLCVPCKQEQPGNQILFLRGLVERMMGCYADADTFLYDLVNAFNRDGIRRLSDMKDLLRRLDDPEQAGEQEAAAQVSAAVQEEKLKRVAQEAALPAQNPVSPVGFEIQKTEKKTASVGFQIPGKEEEVFQIPDRKENKKIKIRKESKKKPDSKAEKTAPKVGIAGRIFGKGGEKESAAGKNAPSLPETPENIAAKADSAMYESYEATVMVADVQLPAQEADSTRMLGLTEVSGILTRRKTQERFYIGAGESIIGSGSAAACIISGNKAISRLHMILRLEEDRISVMDNHSSNGTWVDGRKLIAGETVFVKDRTVIKLADEEFDFELNGL